MKIEEWGRVMPFQEPRFVGAIELHQKRPYAVTTFSMEPLKHDRFFRINEAARFF